MGEQGPPNSLPDTDQDLSNLVGISKTVGKTKARTSTTLLAMQESLKEKQLKYKEQRANRFQELQLPQRHVCDMVAMYLGLEPNDILEGVVDEEVYVRQLNSILEKDGTRCIFFFYQDGPPYTLGGFFQ
ncbi:uncharacterized protein LOC143198703 [Rhynchophorus ferrugineus]|uniref:uncharacterized protein LOC143198703 n=1 Tax=Rhynchophorus ferrugineus TaxID=354439 RepID=UPI003FCD696E